jgi:hypothetical protein
VVGMQVCQFLVPPPYIRVNRTLRHFAAMLFALTVIGQLIIRHGQLQLTSGSFVMLTSGAMPVNHAAPVKQR